MSAMSMAQEIIKPICDTAVAQTAVQILQIEGYLKREEIKDENFEAKVIGFKKIGATPLGYGATEVDPDDILYQIIEYIKIKSGKNIIQQEISDSPSGLSVKLHWEGVSLPSPMATVETPADRPGSQPSHRPEGRGFKPELVLR